MPTRRIRIRQSKQQINIARKGVHKWFGWFIPPAILLILLAALRVDRDLIAVCLLTFPLVIIRLVEAWSDYQLAREQA